MSNHTPGPWHVNAISENRIVGDETAPAHTYSKLTINNSNATVATVYRPRDARLIAAAPGLLAALHDVLDAFQACIGLEALAEFEASNDAVIRAESAIAKAEGQS